MNKQELAMLIESNSTPTEDQIEDVYYLFVKENQHNFRGEYDDPCDKQDALIDVYNDWLYELDLDELATDTFFNKTVESIGENIFNGLT